MGSVEIWPQDAPAGPRPQDRVVLRDAPAGRTGLTPDWYPSPDGSRTLSWWTGRRWSRSLPRRPLPRDLTPPLLQVKPGREPRRRSVPVALALSLAGGPLGSVYANWRVGLPMATMTWLAVANSQEPFPSSTYALLLPIHAGLAAHLAARHNERVDREQAVGEVGPRWRPTDRPDLSNEFARRAPLGGGPTRHTPSHV